MMGIISAEVIKGGIPAQGVRLKEGFKAGECDQEDVWPD